MPRWVSVTLIMAAAGGAVLAATVGIAALVLPETPQTATSAELAPTPEAASPASTTPAIPIENGGTLEMAGERSYTVSLRSSAQLFPDEAAFTVTSGSDFVELSRSESGLHIEQAALDGINFFLDTDECALDEEEVFETAGLVRLRVSCPNVAGAGGSPKVTIEGTLDLPIMIGVNDGRYASGGTLTLGDTAGTELPVERATWMVEFDERTHEQIGGHRFPVVGVVNDEMSWTVWLDGGIDVTEVTRFVAEIGDQAVDLGEGCSVTENTLGKVAPNADYLEVTVDCPELTDPDGNLASLSGTVRIHRFSVFVPDFDF